ncbi:alpha/beta hydrolase [Candidatus Pantoea deserta]|uniref:Alpha/beta hydrolase n=1 Tax=Candidatus Pantoea deserta TaxID=1869313 RepID=A0A3N4P1D5_9GAMM|nr:alpha/beta hydrolase fold domain-containing protein [Pantoea deserta]RPD93193.1 alpha/beta hydrolase [Pantoea deserta]
MSYVIDKQLHEQLNSLQPQLAAFPEFTPGDPSGWRRRANELYKLVNLQFPFQEGLRTVELHIPFQTQMLQARRYSPDDAFSRGVVLYVHGGGGVAGSVELYDRLVRAYAYQSNVDFISLEYGLAPETPGLTQTEQVISAISWLQANSEELGIDPERIVLMGDSGGGGIAASAALLARDREIKLAGLVMVYPMLDHRTASEVPELTPYLSVTAEEAKTAWAARLGDEIPESRLYAISPASAVNYAGLAPVYMDVGELDLFRRENLEWIHKALRAAVQVEFHLFSGVNHGFELLAPTSDAARQAFDLRSRAIKRMIA